MFTKCFRSFGVALSPHFRQRDTSYPCSTEARVIFLKHRPDHVTFQLTALKAFLPMLLGYNLSPAWAPGRCRRPPYTALPLSVPSLADPPTASPGCGLLLPWALALAEGSSRDRPVFLHFTTPPLPSPLGQCGAYSPTPVHIRAPMLIFREPFILCKFLFNMHLL